MVEGCEDGCVVEDGSVVPMVVENRQSSLGGVVNGLTGGGNMVAAVTVLVCCWPF